MLAAPLRTVNSVSRGLILALAGSIRQFDNDCNCLISFRVHNIENEAECTRGVVGWLA